MNILFFLLPKDKTHFCYDTYTIRQVLEKLENSGFTSMILINKKGEYVKTISEGDILRYIKKNSNLNLNQAEKIKINTVDVKRDVKSVKAYANIEDLLEVALDQNFVPIVDDMNRFIGIITRKSIISYFVNENKKKGIC